MSKIIEIKKRIEKNRNDRMIEEVKNLLGDHNELLRSIFEIFQGVIQLGICYLKKPCFNERFVDVMSTMLRENGVSFAIPMEKDAIMRATCCSYYNSCPKCRAFCCLAKLRDLQEGENALLNQGLCEEVCRCVLNGAGIFGLSLLFALLWTSPDFREDSLILFVLQNTIKEDTWKAAAEIAKIFFNAARNLELHFLFFEPRDSAELREKRYEELDEKELALCTTLYAADIAKIQEEEAAAEAAALEEKKRGMPRCQICFGDPIDYPPVYFPITCKHIICCEKCLDSKDGGEKLNHICPECKNPFTEDDIWYI